MFFSGSGWGQNLKDFPISMPHLNIAYKVIKLFVKVKHGARLRAINNNIAYEGGVKKKKGLRGLLKKGHFMN